MSNGANIRDLLLSKGFFPEVLPPCFDSSRLSSSFSGMIRDLEKKKFHSKVSAYIRYSGTKHDGNRRFYGSVNPIPYFLVCQFIGKHWGKFESQFSNSDFGVSNLSLGSDGDDRALLVPALSEISPKLSQKIKYAPHVIKTDIAQFFPSIYTHSLVWVAHGQNQAKKDTSRNSTTNYFNALDWHIQQCQQGQTRGIIVGPDAFRVIAEFIACEIDSQLKLKAGNVIVGGIRHVDDFYIGIKSEIDSSIVLSHLRDSLQNFELQINDNKTKLLSGLQPIDDIWAQELRKLSLSSHYFSSDDHNFLLDKAYDTSQDIASQSPMKLALRRLDRAKCYRNQGWVELEPKLQRILYHFPHCLDYVCLLLAKRFAIKEQIDVESWRSILQLIIERSLSSNHHHELVWLIWVSFVCNIELESALIVKIAKVENGHIKSILIAGYKSGYCKTNPGIKLGSNLSTDDENWLHNLVARSCGYTGAKFSGPFAQEFTTLVSNRIKLIDFEKHMKEVSKSEKEAISKTKYGYDADSDDEETDFDIDYDYNDSDLPF